MRRKDHRPLTTLSYRPITPGSELHVTLLARTRRLGRTLYPDLYARRDAETHRRASAMIAAAASRVATKQDPPNVSAPEGSTTATDLGSADGCNTECA